MSGGGGFDGLGFVVEDGEAGGRLPRITLGAVRLEVGELGALPDHAVGVLLDRQQRKVLRGVRIQLDALDGDIYIAIPGAFGARDLARAAAFRAVTFHGFMRLGFRPSW